MLEAGTFAVSAQHRHFLRDRLFSYGIDVYGKALAKALDQLWKQPEAAQNHADWTTKQPPIEVIF